MFGVGRGVTVYRLVWSSCVWGREGSHCVQACMVYRCFCVEGSGIVQTCMVYAFA